MLPLYLSIEGLYSYQEKQEIDFTKLTEAGLFGIFGKVGSGKSSILEAISYALYGETERLNKQEKRSYNMLNLKSDQAIIDFQFLNFENRKFRFIVQWKRRKKFEDTTTIERNAYEWISDTWQPMESADGTLVTNLSYPNFRRTIIIPQGQFKEFLELKGKDRSDMMKEIFFLNKYDLGPKVSYLQAENNKKLENIKGALTGFEEVSEEIKEQKTVELKNIQQELVAIKTDYEKFDKLLIDLTKSKENRRILIQKQQEWEELSEKHNKIELLEKEVLEYESVSLNFKEHINNLHKITALKEQLLLKIEKFQDNKDTLSGEIKDIDNQISTLQPDFDQLDAFKKQVLEFELLMKNQDLNEEKKQLTKRYENGIPFLEEVKNNEQLLTKNLQQAEEEIEQLKSSRVNTSELLAIETWFLTLDELTRKDQDILNRLNSTKNDINTLKTKFNNHNVEIDTWQNYIKERQDLQKNEQIKIQEKESNLRLKKELSKYILTLHDGEACPLCGSSEHPNIMHASDVSQEFEELDNIKEKWEKTQKELQVIQNELSTASEILIDKLAQENSISLELEKNNESKVLHDSYFKWSDFDKSDRNMFEKQKELVKQLEISITDKDLKIKELRNSLEDSKTKIKSYELKLNEIKNKIQILDSNINQNLSQISILKEIDYSNLNKMELIINSNQLSDKINFVEQKYRELSQLVQDCKSKLATNNGQLSESQEQHKAYTAQLQSLQATINILLREHGFADIPHVKTILDKTIDTNNLKITIQEFYQNLNSVSERIKELQELSKDDNYSEELFDNTNVLVEEKKHALEKCISETGALEKELQNIITELDKKSDLLIQYAKINTRKDNLKTLDNMFKGNGFVNYVSSIHLERLCEIANHRFHRLTKNQLSLCVNESNEFEVKDYLNNGYQRSVKTLSGGQSFQASLCLALALAENIQSLNKSDRNFFFIDEGFGTQDNESINTVFDTLQYLNQENRIVGIISHVEELKERMPRSITVTKDLDKGSHLICN